ncbi:MAG: lysine--tRNA ligase [Clostridia bacterium]|nr:lysine--tRNA ligase [Clostridia bacterium]
MANHWADEVAENIIAKYPNREEYTIASGASPSGILHMGNLREILTPFFVVKALRDKGKKVRFIFSLDNYDRLRKVSTDIQTIAPEFYKNIGKPYTMCEDPFGCHKSYAEHFEQQFLCALDKLGVQLDVIRQTQQYTSGAYVEGVIKAIQNRKKIYDIQYSFKTQEASEEERENYYPIEIYCSQCGKDFTTVTKESENGAVLEYECKCGHHDKIDLRKDYHYKLAWKIDWPMRWAYEGVVFETGGRDHSSEGGSYQVSSVIAREIYGVEPPLYRMYDFVKLKGQTKKISSSAGVGDMHPEFMLKIYAPEVILWMYNRFLPEKEFELALDSDVLRTYHEYDRMYQKYRDGTATDIEKRIMEFSLAGKPANFVPVNASLIASFAPIVNFDIDMLVDLLNKCGEKVNKQQVQDRFECIKFWMQKYCPDEIAKLLEQPNTQFVNTMTEEEKGWVRTLVSEMKEKDLDTTQMQTLLYEIPKLDGQQDKQRQKRFFEIVYNLLLGKNQGPRMYLFLSAVDKNALIHLLDI